MFCTDKTKYRFMGKVHYLGMGRYLGILMLGLRESFLPMDLSKLTLGCLTMLAGGGVVPAGLGGSDTATALSKEPETSSTTQSHKTIA